GSLPEGTAGRGWLIHDRRYEDLELRFWFKCRKTEAGVLLRRQQDGDGTQGIYLAICGENVSTASRLRLHADGSEYERSTISAPHNQDPDEPAQFPQRPDGWNEIDIFLRGDMLVVSQNGYRARPYKLGKADRAEGDRYGEVALGFGQRGGAEIRIKDLAV